MNDTALSLDINNSKDSRTTKLRFFRGAHYDKFKIPSLPSNEHEIKTRNWIASAKGKLLDLFDSDDSCAVFMGYHHSLALPQLTAVSAPLQEPFDPKKTRDRELFSAVIDAVRHPSCVQNTAEKLIAEMFGTARFVAIHWRYDLEEWGRVFSDKLYTKYMYKNLKRIHPRDVADGVRRSLEALDITAKALFVSSAPSLRGFAEAVGKELDIEKTVIGSRDYLLNNCGACLRDNGWDLEEVVSMLDMELCERSSVFYFSQYSSWSENVRPKRTRSVVIDGRETVERRREFSVYHVSLQAMRQRLSVD